MSNMAPTSDYWEERKNWHYYQKVVELAREFAPQAHTVIEVGPRETPFLERVNWIPSKTAIDRYFRPTIQGATNLQGDFLEFQPPHRFDLVLCLQVLEHLEEPQPFASKLLETGNIVIVSVPYKWRKGYCKWHLQDPVDEAKLLSWTKKEWLRRVVVEDDGAERLIAVFEGVKREDERAVSRPEVRPTKIRLEASSFCQLRCPSCPTTSKAIHPAVGSGFLKLHDFQKLLDDNPWIKAIELSNYGEIFLNPDLLGIIRYAAEREVTLSADNGVNLNHVKAEVLEGLVRYKFRSMTCSIDGASNETYSVYRVRGNFDNVIENIKQINFFKQKYQSQHPLLLWQFVVFGHNEHEIPLARKLASELGMRFHLKLSWDAKFSPVKDEEFVRSEIGVASRAEFKDKHGVNYMQSICHQLWDQPQINWDGKVLGCCRNCWGDFGQNTFQDGLLESINGEKIRYAREMLLGHESARSDIPCTTCSIYLGMRAEGKWLKRPVTIQRRAPADGVPRGDDDAS
jgi:hypothetical protein